MDGVRVPGARIRPRARKVPGVMNGLERRYELDVLRLRKLAGEIVRYRYEAIRLKLAPNTHITVDFVVTFEDHIEMHEVKGVWQDDARAKLKIAAGLYPEFEFVAVTYEKVSNDPVMADLGKVWNTERFPNA
jgi:hypothetical protein